MKYRKLVLAAALAMLFTLATPAAELQGYLMDKMCAQKSSTPEAAAKHDRNCLIGCARNGYGVLTSDGKFIPFDKEGNRKAAELLKGSDKKDNFKVDVTGEEQGGVLKVKTLKLA